MTDSIKKEFPDYYRNKAKTQLFTLNNVKEQLDDSTVVISYNWDQSKTNYGINGLAFSKTANQFFRITDSPAFVQALNDFNTLIKTPFKRSSDHLKFQEVSSQVYKHLFSNELNDFIKNKRLIIIPDGQLQNIPFEALIDDEGMSTYMIESHDISYAYSMSFLFHNQSVERKASRSFIG